MKDQVKKKQAATYIQASYRGYKVRKRLQEALKASKLMDEDEFEYKEAEFLDMDISLFGMEGCIDKPTVSTSSSQESTKADQEILSCPTSHLTSICTESHPQSQGNATSSAVEAKEMEKNLKRQVSRDVETKAGPTSTAPLCPSIELRASDRCKHAQHIH